MGAYLTCFESHPRVASAGGRIVARYKGERPKWMSSYTERPIANPIDLGREPRPFPKGRIPGGGNMAIRASIIESYGAFDTNLGRIGKRLLGGEESDLFERLRLGGERCWYVPKAVMWHIIEPEKLTDDYLDRLSYNIGVTQRARAAIVGRGVLLPEMMKWLVTMLIALVYCLTLHFAKARKLVRMRWNISKGLMESDNSSDE